MASHVLSGPRSSRHRVTVRFSDSLILRFTVVLACLVLAARPVAAQDQKVDSTSGLWLSAGALIGGTLLDGNTSRTWSGVGDPGPGVGGAFAAGLDVGRYGAAVGLEAAMLKVGDRRASSVALAATLRWWPPLRRVSNWEPMFELGYVRFGLGGTRVLPAEVPADLFRSGTQVPKGPDDNMRLLGNGLRVGMTVEHRFLAGSLLMLGLGADVVHFDAATYQGLDQSLTRPGWGIAPRTILGVRMPVLLNSWGGGTRSSGPAEPY